MAMPMDFTEEQPAGPDDYKRTCIDFIESISHDYKAWVDYYKLPPDEDARRRAVIDAVISRTGEWIAKVATGIRSIDVVMNDGIQKMAEATAGMPFQIGVFVDGRSGYTMAKAGLIPVRVRADGRDGRTVKLGFHFKDDRFRLESTCGAAMREDGLPLQEEKRLDVQLLVDAQRAKPRDVISFTVTVLEIQDGQECDKRGVSTLIHIV